MGITVGDLLVQLGLDDSSLISGLNDAQKAIEKHSKSWQDSLKGIAIQQAALGAAITASMTKIVQAYASTGSELYDLSLKTGVSAKSLAGLQYAAEQSGGSLSTIEMAMKRVSVVMEEAKDPTSAAAKALQELGISTSDLIGLSPEQQFLKIANSIAKIPDPMSRSAAAVKIFSRSGTDLLPMLADGADGLQKMMTEGEKLSGWTDKGAKSADSLGDAFATLKTATAGVVDSLGAAFAPVLKSIVDKLVPVIANIREWISNNSAWAKNIGIFAGTLGVLASTIAVVTGAQWLWNIAMDANPIGAIILAIEGLIAVGVLLAANWDKVTKFFKDSWDLIKLAFATAVKWISNTVLLPFIEFYGKILGLLTEGVGKVVGLFNKDLGASIADFGNKMINARSEIGKWSDAIVTGARDSISWRQAQVDLGNAAKDATDKMTTGVEDYTSAAKTAAQTAADAQIDGINKALTAAQTAHDSKMKLLDVEYAGILKNIDAALGNTISGLDSQISDIQKQQQANADAITERQNQEKVASLQSQILTENDATRKAALQKELDDFLVSLQEEKTRRGLDDQIAALRQQENDARNSAQTQKDIAQTTYNDKKAILDTQLTDFQTEQANEITQINLTLAATTAAYDADQKAFDALLADKTKSMADYVTGYNAWVAQMGAMPSTPGAPSLPGTTPPPSMFAPPNPYPSPAWSVGLKGNIPGYVMGGVVSGAIGQPQLAVVHGGEMITPNGATGGHTTVVNQYIAGSVRTDRELLAFVHEGLLVGNRSNAHLGFS